MNIKLICIVDNMKPVLTKGKIYDAILDEHFYNIKGDWSIEYMITNDIGQTLPYWSEYFSTLEEHRDNKINDIIK
jgi:hypothetical protein